MENVQALGKKADTEEELSMSNLRLLIVFFQDGLRVDCLIYSRTGLRSSLLIKHEKWRGVTVSQTLMGI